MSRLSPELRGFIPVDAQGVTAAIDYLADTAGFSVDERRALIRPHAVNPAVMHARVFGRAPLARETVVGSFVEGARVRADALASLADVVGGEELGLEVRKLLLAVSASDGRRRSGGGLAASRHVFRTRARRADDRRLFDAAPSEPTGPRLRPRSVTGAGGDAVRARDARAAVAADGVAAVIPTATPAPPAAHGRARAPRDAAALTAGLPSAREASTAPTRALRARPLTAPASGGAGHSENSASRTIPASASPASSCETAGPETPARRASSEPETPSRRSRAAPQTERASAVGHARRAAARSSG